MQNKVTNKWFIGLLIVVSTNVFTIEKGSNLTGTTQVVCITPLKNKKTECDQTFIRAADSEIKNTYDIKKSTFNDLAKKLSDFHEYFLEITGINLKGLDNYINHPLFKAEKYECVKDMMQLLYEIHPNLFKKENLMLLLNKLYSNQEQPINQTKPEEMVGNKKQLLKNQGICLKQVLKKSNKSKTISKDKNNNNIINQKKNIIKNVKAINKKKTITAKSKQQKNKLKQRMKFLFSDTSQKKLNIWANNFIDDWTKMYNNISFDNLIVNSEKNALQIIDKLYPMLLKHLKGTKGLLTCFKNIQRISDEQLDLIKTKNNNLGMILKIFKNTFRYIYKKTYNSPSPISEEKKNILKQLTFARVCNLNCTTEELSQIINKLK
jgi:hypothetical protein